MAQQSSQQIDPFAVLDAETLYQVVARLAADDVARLLCTTTHLYGQLSAGRHALQLWLGHCRDLLGGAAVGHIAASCKADQARTWVQLYTSARTLDRLHWSPAAPAASSLAIVDHSAHKQQQQDAAAVLARSGHTATAAGSHLVLVGGDLRDRAPAAAAAAAALDVAVLDLPNRRVIKPALYGQQPPSLVEHCTVALAPQPGTALHKQVTAAVAETLSTQPNQQSASSSSSSSGLALTPAQQAQQLVLTGHALAVFGGLMPDGSEQPSVQEQLHILWLHPDADWGLWVCPSTTGDAPAPRAFACCAGISGGSQLLVYGGSVHCSMAGTVQSDVGEFGGYLLLCVYLLDTATLTWSRVPTRPLNEPPRHGHVMLGPSTCPGPRKRALSCLRVNPVTGQEEFMLLGGCGVDGLADFVPYSLNLDTFFWTKGPVMGYLPPARRLCSVMRLTPTWLVMMGGQGPAREHLQDIQRLHLPTLSWRPPADVACGRGSNSSSGGAAGPAAQQRDMACCATVGCTAEACIISGGVEEGPYGPSITPRLEVLLPGPVIPALEDLQDSSMVNTGLLAPAGTNVLSQQQFLVRHTVPQQQHAAWHAFATTSCRCGCCCSCLAAKAAASGGPACCAAAAADDWRQQQQQQQKGMQNGGVPRWQALGPLDDQPPPGSSKSSGSTHTSSAGTGKCAVTGPVGWSGEFEIEPAPALTQSFPPSAASGLAHRGLGLGAQLGGLGKGWQGPEENAGAERVWQTKSTSSSAQGGALQLLLAVVVVMVGLVLMVPSLMMQQWS